MPKLEYKDPVEALDQIFVIERVNGEKRYARPIELTVTPTGSWELLFEGHERIRSDYTRWHSIDQYRPLDWVVEGSLCYPPYAPDRFQMVEEGEKLDEYKKRMKSAFKHTAKITDAQWKAIYAFQFELLQKKLKKEARQLAHSQAIRAKREEMAYKNNRANLF